MFKYSLLLIFGNSYFCGGVTLAHKSFSMVEAVGVQNSLALEGLMEESWWALGFDILSFVVGGSALIIVLLYAFTEWFFVNKTKSEPARLTSYQRRLLAQIAQPVSEKKILDVKISPLFRSSAKRKTGR